MPTRHPALPASAPEGQSARAWPRFVLVDAARIAALAVAALGIGWTVNALRRQPLAWTYRSPAQRLRADVSHLQPPAPEDAPSPATMTLDAFQAFVAARRGLVIDARPAAFYRHGHVPGALNLPRETFAAEYAGQKTALEPRRTDGTAVYCSEEDCPDAELVAQALGRLGFRPLWVYRAGWEEWAQTGLPQEGAPPP